MVDTAAVNISHQTLFRSEYEQEMESWLRQRFRAVCICYFAVGALVLLMRLLIIGFGSNPNPVLAMVITIVAGLASMAIPLYLLFLYNLQWLTATRQEILRGLRCAATAGLSPTRWWVA